MKGGLDRNKSLEENENDFWPDYEFETSMIKKCHDLRKKPLNEFTLNDYRLMITQKISLSILVPIAIEKLEIDPLVFANHSGDLLEAVLNLNKDFWDSYPALFQRLPFPSSWSIKTSMKTAFETELQKELSREHILYGVDCEYIANSNRDNDFLFAINIPVYDLVVVHLTWSGQEEKNPAFPESTFYKDWNSWLAVNKNID